MRLFCWRRSSARIGLICCGSLFCALLLAAAEKADDLLTQAQAAQRKGGLGEALILATQAIKADPTNAQCYYVRGRLYAEDREHAKAVADFDQALTFEPRAPEIYQLRGLEQFKLGRFQESCADFDKFLQFIPQLWQQLRMRPHQRLLIHRLPRLSRRPHILHQPPN